MTDYVDISLDSETWGNRAGMDIRSYGACVFDIHTGNIDLDPFHIACDNPLKQSYPIDETMSQKQLDKLCGGHRRYNLLRDERTVDWWYDRPHELWKAFDNPVDLKEATIKLREYILEQSNDVRDGQAHDVRVWSHGAAYDPPILEAVFHAVEVQVPWFYRSPRDTRTIYDLAEVGNHSQWQVKYQQGLLHHAMWDSISQAGAISGAFQRIKVQLPDAE